MNKIYPILWVYAPDILETNENAMLGICSYSKQVFSIVSPSNTPFLLIVTDIIINEAGCEDAEGCLCFECPLNKTTKQSFLRRVGKQSAVIAKWIDFDERAPIAANNSAQAKQRYSDLITRYLHGGIMHVERDGNKRGKKAIVGNNVDPARKGQGDK